MSKWIVLLSVPAMLAAFASVVHAQEWQPAKGPLMTRWAKDVKPDNVLPEYPRPQMVRKDWQNLNGLWDYAIRPKAEAKPEKWDGNILVPFAAESALSGVMKDVGKDNRLWYRRTFTVPDGWKGKHVLLHFGAVDWETTVWVNGKEVGSHKGGYDPFTFDLADAIQPGKEHELVVAVWDPTDAGEQPRGKQLTNPKGIWYTPVTGIWQTVWIEPVPSDYAIESLKIVPDVDRGVVRVDMNTSVGAIRRTNPRFGGLVDVYDGETLIASGQAGKDIAIPDAKLWTPDDPFLYRLEVRLVVAHQREPRLEDIPRSTDAVQSYFAMRKVSMAMDDKGVQRLLLNNKPVFHFGPLDQGWWPDGLYTAPTDEALKYDIEITKALGFNMARKHTKVEPARWYYWADKLGLMVWQDMPSGYPFAKWDPIGTHDNTEAKRDAESTKQFDVEHKAMIDALYNHPSIVMWVPFNEGWGQFDTVRVTNWVKQYDPTRLVNAASGGNDFPVGDIKDIHVYPGPGAPTPDAGENPRALVLGEYGGLGLTLDGHVWPSERKWGYRDYRNADDLTDAYRNLTLRLRRFIDEPGLAAAVYTQTTDVEGEVNGLLTYDRAVVKIPEATIREIHDLLKQAPAAIKMVVPDSRTQPAAAWRYTTEKPPEGWEKPDFDDSSWKTGPAGFGTDGLPHAVANTKWNAAEIWIRRSFELPADAVPARPHLSIHHRGDAAVFLNGVEAVRLRRHTLDYVEQPVTPESKAALKPGKNVLAAHCKQGAGGQFIDVGLVEVVPAGKPE